MSFDTDQRQSSVAMRNPPKAHLGAIAAPFCWLFEPRGTATSEDRAFLLSQLLASPASTMMGAFCSLIVLSVAVLRNSEMIYAILIGLEVLLVAARLIVWRYHINKTGGAPPKSVSVDFSVCLSLAWCLLQGSIAFIVLQGDDPVLHFLAATLIMALIGPICARNYAAPRYAMFLVLLCDLPFVLGAVLSGEIWLWAVVVMTPPFLFGAAQIITTFNRVMLSTLAAKEQNRYLAMHDSLTGILNRQGMDLELSSFLATEGRTMALLTLDLDSFKEINDTYGHGAGDLVLVEVARRLRACVRATDLVARMGGDEFVAVVRNMNATAIPQLAEKVIEAVSGEDVVLADGTAIRVGASLGYACLPEDAVTATELRLRADRALYDAKNNGKGGSQRYQEHAA
ncbi:GGDEF domain-containing protein [Roseibium sp.]|uniref:GGDEF domain-containing protein n=1 Tax=Roseibium sp. TaxID=1936156 RepID=UPI003296B166